MLDLLEANCPLDESIDSRTMETLRFRHSESDRDTETDSLRDDRRAISLGDEIYEEAGWWIELSVSFIQNCSTKQFTLSNNPTHNPSNK